MKKVELGAAGKNVAKHVREYRQDRGLSYAELSRHLDKLDRPIPPLGLRQLEAGKRRVDVDELVALGQALGVSFYVLLLPHRFYDVESDVPLDISEETEAVLRMADRTPKKDDHHGDS